MAEHTKYQQKVIRNYYDNRDGIALQRVQELVTELYLSRRQEADQALGQPRAAPGQARRQARRDRPPPPARTSPSWSPRW